MEVNIKTSTHNLIVCNLPMAKPYPECTSGKPTER